jgi:hypothetical protein
MYKWKRQRFEGAKEKKKSVEVIEVTRKGIRKPIEEVVK